MSKIDIKELFNHNQQAMLSEFGLSSVLNHPVSKGNATEAEWIKWFTDYFPSRYKAEKAFVIDCRGNCSEQIDIVIYDTHFSPKIFEFNNEKYIPAESVYAVFEVKQELSKDYLQYAAHKIKSVKELIRTSAPINTINGLVPGRAASPIIGGLLSTKTKWINGNMYNNIENSISEIVTNEKNSIDFICCLSSFACAIEYCFEKGSFFEKEIVLPKFKIIQNGNNGVLIFTYFKLLRMLQDMGNAPAIEFSKYGIEGIDPSLAKNNS